MVYRIEYTNNQDNVSFVTFNACGKLHLAELVAYKITDLKDNDPYNIIRVSEEV